METSQKQIILNMLTDKEWTCVTEMMQAFIPDFRRRICDLKDDGYILTGKPCNLHTHKSKNLKMWHLISSPQDRKIGNFLVMGTSSPELKKFSDINSFYPKEQATLI